MEESGKETNVKESRGENEVCGREGAERKKKERRKEEMRRENMLK